MIVPNISIRGVLAAPALLLTLLLAACGAPSEQSAPADGAAPAAPAAGPAAVSNDTGSGPIRIGQFSSLSGSEATFGISTDNGIKLALEEQNAAGGVKGRTIEMTTYDTQGKDAGTPVTRLITSDKVVAVLGEVASSLSIAGGRVAQQYGVPLISPASTNPQVTMIGDMVFRVCFIDPYQGYVAAKFLHDNQQMTRVAVLYDQTQAYSKGLRDFFTKAFVELGGQITIEQAYTGGDQDFTAQLTSIRESNPQAIYCPGYYTDIGNIALQARKLGITVPMMGGDGWDSVKLPEIAGPAIEGSFYSNHYSPQDTRPEVKTFVDKYEKTYGQTPDALAALGYDAAKILFAAMERAPSLSGADLAKAISETKGHSGVTGMISLDAQRNAMKSAVVVKLEGGKPVFVTNIDPPKAD